MATYNTVPLGQAGTGAAFRLGENRALPLFQQDIERQRLEREAEAQRLAKSWRENALAASKGQLFASELGKIEQDHIQKGYQLRQQGIDPYNPDVNNPQAFQQAQEYMAERRDIENKRAYRDGIEARYKQYMDTLSKATEGEYDAEKIAEINKIVSEGRLSDLYARGATLPTLEKRVNTRDILKGVKAPVISTTKTVNGNIETDEYVDKNAARQVVLATIANSPTGQSVLLKATGGIPVQDVVSLPESKEEIKKRVTEDYMGSPERREQLALNQIRVGSPQFNQLMEEESEVLFKAKKGLNTLINDGVNQISQGIKTVDTTKPEMTEAERRRLAIAEQNLALARQRENRIASDADERKTTGTASVANQRAQWIDDMLDGVPGSGERLKGIIGGTTGYKGDVRINTSKPNEITIQIPERETEKMIYGKNKKIKVPSRTITVKKNDPQSKSKLNQFLNEVTEEKVTESKLNTSKTTKVNRDPLGLF